MDINWQKILLILFELTIFIILVVQLLQLMTQFLLPFLRKKIAELSQFWKDLQNKINLLSKTKNKLKEKIKEQEEVLDDLEDKIKVWHKKIEQKQLYAEKEKEKFIKKLNKEKEEQYANLNLIKEQKSVLPKALKKTREKLKKEFSGGKGKKLLSEVVKNLEIVMNGEK